MQEFLDACFRWPTVPATTVLVAACVYWLFVLLGALDFDLLDFDIDIDADSHGLSDIGFISLKFLNIADVPLMIWGSVFALAWWTASISIDGDELYSAGGEIALAVARNVGIALVVTKVLTQPLKGRFHLKEPHAAGELIGRTCVISTSEATEAFGRASYATGGAPLDLNVRALNDPLPRGATARIVDYDAERRVYYVCAADATLNGRRTPEE